MAYQEKKCQVARTAEEKYSDLSPYLFLPSFHPVTRSARFFVFHRTHGFSCFRSVGAACARARRRADDYRDTE